MVNKKDLRKDNSIIITKPDKGNGVVIINKLDYLNKMKLLISDATKFKKLTQNPTKSREDSLISYLRKLKKDKIINDATLHKILPCGSTPSVLYGLPKVHKPGLPFSPDCLFSKHLQLQSNQIKSTLMNTPEKGFSVFQ